MSHAGWRKNRRYSLDARDARAALPKVSMPTSWCLSLKRNSLRQRSICTIVTAFHPTWANDFGEWSRRLTCAETVCSPMAILQGNSSAANSGGDDSIAFTKRILTINGLVRIAASKAIYNHPLSPCLVGGIPWKNSFQRGFVSLADSVEDGVKVGRTSPCRGLCSAKGRAGQSHGSGALCR